MISFHTWWMRLLAIYANVARLVNRPDNGSSVALPRILDRKSLLGKDLRRYRREQPVVFGRRRGQCCTRGSGLALLAAARWAAQSVAFCGKVSPANRRGGIGSRRSVAGAGVRELPARRPSPRLDRGTAARALWTRPSWAEPAGRFDVEWPHRMDFSPSQQSSGTSDIDGAAKTG